MLHGHDQILIKAADLSSMETEWKLQTNPRRYELLREGKFVLNPTLADEYNWLINNTCTAASATNIK